MRGSSGTGRAVAAELVRRGREVLLVGCSLERLLASAPAPVVTVSSVYAHDRLVSLPMQAGVARAGRA